MGHSVFLDRNNKPNFRIHVIIFVLIAGISIFLSALMEKSKVNTDIAALKSPVPIDSIELEVKTENGILPSIKPPIVEKAVLKTAVFADVKTPDSTFNGHTNTSIREEPLGLAAETQVATVNAEMAQLPVSTQIEANSNPNSTLAEAILAKLPEVQDNSQMQSQTDTENEVQVVGQSEAEVNTSELKKVASINMDQAYQQQQDRFLLTLAKSAELESIDSSDIARIKDAILHDKALPPADAENGQSAHPLAKSNVQLVSAKKSLHVKNASHDKNPDSALTQGELDQILNQFTLYYNEGDIRHLMALFASNASTNDRQSKLGIKQDYNELFQNTESRRLKIKGMQWNLGKGKAEGQASFEVAVKQKNSLDTNLYRGSIKIIAIKESHGVYITHLIHEVNPQ